MRKTVTIGITLGDPAGIGPEVVAGCLSDKRIRSAASLCLIGDRSVFSLYRKRLPDNCVLLDQEILAPGQCRPGRPSRLSAHAALAYLSESVSLLKKGRLDALVTAPVCKETIDELGDEFVGHTEFLAQNFHVRRYAMMFVAPGCKTVILTRHIPLKDVPSAVTQRKVLDAIELVHTALKNQFHITSPKIAVCGLNPHAGENGLIGSEDMTRILPAVKKAQKKGWTVRGPFAADTLFCPSNARKFDALIAMYHDQGLIPVKSLYFDKLVNLTIGLPFIRTSPAHGTAFDIAGQGLAKPHSMRAAVRLAAELAR